MCLLLDTAAVGTLGCKECLPTRPATILQAFAFGARTAPTAAAPRCGAEADSMTLCLLIDSAAVDPQMQRVFAAVNSHLKDHGVCLCNGACQEAPTAAAPRCSAEADSLCFLLVSHCRIWHSGAKSACRRDQPHAGWRLL